MSPPSDVDARGRERYRRDCLRTVRRLALARACCLAAVVIFSAHALERAERSRVDVAGAARAALAAWAHARLSRALERAEDALAAVGTSSARDVEMQTLHASTAGGIWAALKTGDEAGVRRELASRGIDALRERGPVWETPLLLMFLYGGGEAMAESARLRSAKYAGDAYPETVNDVYAGEEYRGESALHIAIVNENDELVDWLLRRTPDAAALLSARATGRFFARDAPCYYGEYALSFAVSTGQGSLVNTLLEAGADATAQDTHGNTCLHLAVIHNRPEMYDALCEKWTGKAVDRIVNEDGLTPILFAARHGFKDMYGHILGRTCVTEWSYGPVTCRRMPLSDVDTRQGDGRGALLEIVENGHTELLELPLMQELVQRKWDCYGAKLYYDRLYQVIGFMLTTTFVHVTSYADAAETNETRSVAAHTAKTAVLFAVLAQLAHECTHRRNGASAVSAAFCVSYLAAAVARSSSFQCEIFADALLAAAFLFAWFHCTQLFMGFRSIGHFIIMTYEIVENDVRPFAFILAIFVLSFSTAFYVVLRPSADRSLVDFNAQILSCFEWLTNGGFESDVARDAARASVVLILLLAAFSVLGSVVVLNLLVAMMGDTYARVSENATAKWRLARARILLALERRVSVATRDRLAAGVWIVVDGARFLQVQLVRGVLRDAPAKTP